MANFGVIKLFTIKIGIKSENSIGVKIQTNNKL